MQTLHKTDDYEIGVRTHGDQLVLGITIDSIEIEQNFYFWLEKIPEFTFDIGVLLNGQRVIGWTKETLLKNNFTVCYEFFECENPNDCFSKVIDFFFEETLKKAIKLSECRKRELKQQFDVLENFDLSKMFDFKFNSID